MLNFSYVSICFLCQIQNALKIYFARKNIRVNSFFLQFIISLIPTKNYFSTKFLKIDTLKRALLNLANLIVKFIPFKNIVVPYARKLRIESSLRTSFQLGSLRILVTFHISNCTAPKKPHLEAKRRQAFFSKVVLLSKRYILYTQKIHLGEKVEGCLQGSKCCFYILNSQILLSITTCTHLQRDPVGSIRFYLLVIHQV